MYVQQPMFYLAGALALVFVACASPSGPATSPAEARTPASGAETSGQPGHAEPAGSQATERPEGVALGRIELQNHVVTIYGGDGDDPRFGVATRDGRTIAAEISRDEFQSRYPGLFKSFETARARTDASLAPNELPGARPGPGHQAP